MAAEITTGQRPHAASYDGAEPFPDPSLPRTSGAATIRVSVTIALVVVPLIGLGLAAWTLWGWGFSSTDLGLAIVLYVVTGFGVTVGYHRGLTHGSFRMSRLLTCVLVLAGSMAYQGAVIEWVATHRRHHAFTDEPGDPHSPYRYGTSLRAQLRGLAHAHAGWFFVNDPTPVERYAPDLLRDPMMRRLHGMFALMCVVSLTLPFLLGVLLTGSLLGGVTAFVWAGLARVALLQHVTWSVNSLCHLVGERPYATRRFDRATNLWPLALLSFGESWHNGHHADPSCARHGRGRWQVDVSAGVIRTFERLGWVTNVHWPSGAPRLSGEVRSVR